MTRDAVIAIKEWVLAAPVGLLLVLPGLGAGYWFAARNRLSHAWALMMAFVASAAWCSLAAITAFYAGLSLDLVAVVYVAAIPISIWMLWRSWREPCGSLERGSGGLILSAIAALTALVQQPWWFGTPDTYYHIAASRSLLVTGRALVTDPFFGTASTLPDSTAGMWNTVQAVVTRVIGTDIASLYRGFTAVGAAVVILAFWLLAKEVARSERAATIATAAYFVAAWFTDFRAFAYPNKLSISFAFVAIAMLVRIASEPTRPFVAAAVLAGFTALTVHLASGELILLCGAGIVFTLALFAAFKRSAEERRAAWRSMWTVAASLVLMVVAALPTLYPRVIALRGTSVLGEDSFIWAGSQLIEGLPLGMRVVRPGGFDFGGGKIFVATAIVGAVMLWALLKGGSRRTAAVLPLVGMAHVITLFPPVSTLALNFSSYMVARMVELLRFSPYVALAWAYGEVLPRSRTAARVAGTLLLAVAIVVSIPYLFFTYVQGTGAVRRGNLYSVSTSQGRDMRKHFGFDALTLLRQEVGDSYPIVAADPETGYHVMGLADIAVVASLPTHTPVFMDRAEVTQRQADMESYFAETTSPTRRAEIVQRWGVEYVFVDPTRNTGIAEELAQAPDLYELVVDQPRVMFYRVTR